MLINLGYMKMKTRTHKQTHRRTYARTTWLLSDHSL